MKVIGKNLIAFAAIFGPLLHVASDILEWRAGGFSSLQLYINLLGFLLMPFMILGLYWLDRRRLGLTGATGALLYAIAFVYFTYSTIYSIRYQVPTYEDLWHRLGWVYTLHGAFMVVGGLVFVVAALRGRAYGKVPVGFFGVGLLINLVVGLLPVPEMIQIAGSMFRNVGLVGMGIEILFYRDRFADR
ncbi:MAG: hypothetical protein HOP17_15975 [Acidobacteria bacterium]|nr:hypothetical protein [Acidobacteriota bacterium]